MAGRFDLNPLLRAVGRGLRKRRGRGVEPVDVRTRTVLVAVPAVVAIVIAATGTDLPAADQFLAATALFLGALLTVFGQVAAWRDRLANRHVATDRVDLRALDEAAAHILFTVLVTLATAILLVVRANLGADLSTADVAAHIVARICAALAAAGFTYLVLIIWLVTNLLWDAYEKSASWPSGDD